MDVFTAKNIMRFMGSLVDLKLLSSLSFSQMITNLLEEQAKSHYHSLDLVLESVMAGLPLAVSFYLLSYIYSSCRPHDLRKSNPLNSALCSNPSNNCFKRERDIRQPLAGLCHLSRTYLPKICCSKYGAFSLIKSTRLSITSK